MSVEPEMIRFLRRVLAERQCATRDGLLMDVTTAAVILGVYDALSIENKANLAAMPLDKDGGSGVPTRAPIALVTFSHPKKELKHGARDGA